MMRDININKYLDVLDETRRVKEIGRVCKTIGLTIESRGPAVSVGEICKVYVGGGKEYILAETVGFRDNNVVLMPLGNMEKIGQGSLVVATNSSLKVRVGMDLPGRILDGLGSPIDDKGEFKGQTYYPINNQCPHPLLRKRIDTPLEVGIKAIDGLLTCGKGQRIGIFSGSGVGKSTLLGMMARNSNADINVIGLIGERGREVREFIEKDLKEDGLSRSIVVVATSDQPALIRVKGALLATTIAEYFRDQGKDVLLLMDSVTRYAMAQREVGLAAGEPPVSRGYTPSVFASLPKLLERAGTSEKGTITGFYTVLVDGDDMNEPIADSVRGILDGHIVLSREIASKNHFPAIDVLASISRVMKDIISKEHNELANQIKNIMASFAEIEDLVNIGAYTEGKNKRMDYCIEKIGYIKDFLKQGIDDSVCLEETLKLMKGILEG